MRSPLVLPLKESRRIVSSYRSGAAFADPLVLSAMRAIGPLRAGGSLNGPQIIDMEAQAELPGGMMVRRHAVVRFGLSPDGRAWRILEWNDG